MEKEVLEITERVKEQSLFVEKTFQELRKIIIGQRYLLERLLIGLLSGGHMLLEGVPGLAKTTAIKGLASTILAKFQRIQFTPDLLPADLLGTQVYNPKSGDFFIKKGPIFCNILLADEINRAPAKVQSALLEAMQEKQVTIADMTFALEEPFMVLATQNPIEQEGTYPLPEAQVDRFMLKICISYPSKEEERQIIDLVTMQEPPEVKAVITTKELFEAREVLKDIYMDEKIKNYIVSIVMATRKPKEYGLDAERLIEYGASPRASIYLAQCSRAHAFLHQRGYVTPQDVKAVAMDILRHRVIITYEAEAEEITSEHIIKKVLDHVEVP